MLLLRRPNLLFPLPPPQIRNDMTFRFRGFTLIELLVVIAIIGLLSAIVLAGLNSARKKANDAAIKTDLNTIQTQSQIYYDTNGNYGATNGVLENAGTISSGTTCQSLSNTMFGIDSTIINALTNIKTLSGEIECADNGTSYSINVRLNSGPTTDPYWCIDSHMQAENEPYYYSGGEFQFLPPLAQCH